MDFLKTTINDVYNDKIETEQRDYKAYNRCSEFGKSTIDIDCPFCKTTMTAYIWSICGSGKRCKNCGAILSAVTGAHRRKQQLPLLNRGNRKGNRKGNL